MAYRKWQLQIDNGEPRWGDPMSYYAARDAWNSVILDDVVLQVGEEMQRWQCGPCLVYPDDHKPATDLSHLQRVTDGVSALDVYRECFADVESSIADLATRARTGRIGMGELTGGTFTISNGGVYGSMMSTPILNPVSYTHLRAHETAS